MGQSAEKYNESKAGKLWGWSQLPVHLTDHRARPAAFAKRVAIYQGIKGLVPDGKLGPKTLAALWLDWPHLSGIDPAQKTPAKGKAKATAKAAPEADQPGGVLVVEGEGEPIPLE